MEKMPIVILLLYSIPESIVLVTLGASLYGYDVKKNINRVLLLSILLASLTMLARYFPFGQNIILEVPVFIAVTVLILKTSVSISSLMIITAFIISILTQNLYFSILANVANLTITDLINDLGLRLLVSWIYLIMLCSLTILVIKKNFTFIKTIDFFKPTNSDSKVSLLIIIVLAQALLAGILQMASIFKQNDTFPVWLDSAMLERMIGIALITIPIISIFLLKRVFSLFQQEAIIATQETYLNNINSLFVTIRGQRHDFMNHVQVIYSLLRSNKTDEALKYMDNLLDEIQQVNELIKTKDPALSALLNTKLAVAERHNIEFQTDITEQLEGINVKSLDLVKIIGNLLDNAMEAVSDQPQESRIVKLSIKGYNNIVTFEVFNPRPVIPPEDLDKIFLPGVTTKGDRGHSGLGLAVVKEIVEKYNGHIGVKSTEEEGTTFSVVIPK